MKLLKNKLLSLIIIYKILHLKIDPFFNGLKMVILEHFVSFY